MKTKNYGLVTTKIIRDSDLSITAKTVYSLLCTYADKQRQCYPSIKTLSEILCVHRKTIERAINELKKKNYVIRETKTFRLE